MVQLNAYIHFNGECREAMQFYRECLGGKVNFMPFAGSAMEAMVPPDKKNYIAHSHLESDGMVLVADDMTLPGQVTMGNNISLIIQGEKRADIEGYFNRLAQGARSTQPLTAALFGVFGIINDRFGVSWVLQANQA